MGSEMCIRDSLGKAECCTRLPLYAPKAFVPKAGILELLRRLANRHNIFPSSKKDNIKCASAWTAGLSSSDRRNTSHPTIWDGFCEVDGIDFRPLLEEQLNILLQHRPTPSGGPRGKVVLCSVSILMWCGAQGLWVAPNGGWHRDDWFVTRGDGQGMGIFHLDTVNAPREVLEGNGYDSPAETEDDQDGALEPPLGEVMTEFRLSDSSFSHKVRYNKGMGYFVEGEWIESALHRFECSDGGLRARLGWCAAGTVFPPVSVSYTHLTLPTICSV